MKWRLISARVSAGALERGVLLLCALILVFASAGCNREASSSASDGLGRTRRTVIRVGHFPNVTHAQAMVARNMSRAGKGWFEQRLGPDVEVQWFVYNAGPSAMEAIFARSLDVAYVGPSPAITAHLKSGGEEIRIIAGACNGGAALVVQSDGRILSHEDFRGKKIGTPQLGNTQDVAARAWLQSKGIRVTMTGGDASVFPMTNADLLAQFQKGDLDAAWTVEPWVSRIEQEAGGRVFVEEKDLWKETGGRHVTTHLVCRAQFLKEHPELLRKFIAAHVELTQWINERPDEAKRRINDETRALTTRALPSQILDSAMKRLELTHDPVSASLFKCAEDAHAIGFIRQTPDLTRIYDLKLLHDVLREKGLPEAK